MTNKELERRLEQALSHAAPNDLEGVLSRCETGKGTVIQLKNNKVKAGRWLAAACMALLLVGGGGGVVYQQAYAITSVVSIDVNPSIELTVNRQEKILACTPLNDQAAEILADMGDGVDLKGTKLDVAVNAIVGSLVRHGYLDSISSAILISVEDKDQNRATKLQEELTSTVDAVLQGRASNAAVFSQTVTQNAGLDQQAKENNISTGKAALVNRVMERNSTLKFDQLAALSVEELKDLLEMGAPGMPIGKGQASYLAQQYAGVLEIDSVVIEVDSELDDQPAHYEVELHTHWGDYQYHIDGYTGAVLSGRANITDDQKSTDKTTTNPTDTTKNPADTTASNSTASSGKDISHDKAKAIAFAHAGLSTSDQAKVSGMQIKRDYDDGNLEYEIDFWLGNFEYEYTIDGLTGKILSYEWDDRDTSSSSENQGNSGDDDRNTSTSDIGRDAAVSAALSHAGVKQSQISELEVDADLDDHTPHYEIEFRSGDMEYEYKISATTGAVLEHESDWDD